MESVAKRKKLVDITNITRSIENVDPKLSNAAPCARGDTKNYISQLLNENSALLKLVSERSKMIEMDSIELQKLRITLQKTNQQNLELARANTQLLAELNFCRDRVKALQHELGCKNAVLRSKTSELEEERLSKHVHRKDGTKKDSFEVEVVESCNVNIKSTMINLASSSSMSGEAAAKNDRKRKSSSRRSIMLKTDLHDSSKELETVEDDQTSGTYISESITEDTCIDLQLQAPFTSSCEANTQASQQQEKQNTKKCSRSGTISDEATLTDKDDKERKSSCRRSANLKTEPNQSAARESHKHDDADLKVSSVISKDKVEDRRIQLNQLASSSSSSLKEEDNAIECRDQRGSTHDVKKETRRFSSGRPVRRAAEKVASYKEKPLNVKMRREE